MHTLSLTTHHAEAGYQLSNHSPGQFPSFSWQKCMGCMYVRTEGKSDMHDVKKAGHRIKGNY